MTKKKIVTIEIFSFNKTNELSFVFFLVKCDFETFDYRIKLWNLASEALQLQIALMYDEMDAHTPNFNNQTCSCQCRPHELLDNSDSWTHKIQ